MSRAPLRALAAVLGAGLALATVVAGAGHAAADDQARRLLQRASTAAYRQEFTGEVLVTWQDEGGRRQRKVEVASEDGVLQVGDDSVVGSEGRLVRRTNHGWELLGTGAGGRVPDPTRKYDLVVTRGTPIAGRTTWRVSVRSGGRLRERLFVDVGTGVLLRRDQLDRSGRVDRSVAFVVFTPAAGPNGTTAHVPRADARGSTPMPLRRVPDDVRAPARVDGGFRLVSVLGGSDGEKVQLFYSDGIVGISVFEQPGTVDWDTLPARGAAATVDGTRARAYTTAAGHALVWDSGGVTYTCVSDAPLTDMAAFAAAFGATGSPGWAEQVGRLVTGPFSWD
jgi:hypothetical protein